MLIVLFSVPEKRESGKIGMREMEGIEIQYG
jgi:hypothetical protein